MVVLDNLAPPSMDWKILECYLTIEPLGALVLAYYRLAGCDVVGNAMAAAQTNVDRDIPVPSLREADKDVLRVVPRHMHLVPGDALVLLYCLGSKQSNAWGGVTN